VISFRGSRRGAEDLEQGRAQVGIGGLGRGGDQALRERAFNRGQIDSSQIGSTYEDQFHRWAQRWGGSRARRARRPQVDELLKRRRRVRRSPGSRIIASQDRCCIATKVDRRKCSNGTGSAGEELEAGRARC